MLGEGASSFQLLLLVSRLLDPMTEPNPMAEPSRIEREGAPWAPPPPEFNVKECCWDAVNDHGLGPVIGGREGAPCLAGPGKRGAGRQPEGRPARGIAATLPLQRKRGKERVGGQGLAPAIVDEGEEPSPFRPRVTPVSNQRKTERFQLETI